MTRSKVVVTFHRSYEISDEDINNVIEERFGQDAMVQDDLYLEIAEEMARNFFEEECQDFSDNSKDFVSSTKEIHGWNLK